MTAKPGDAAKAYGKAREAHQNRQALTKALQRQHVGDSGKTPQQLEEQQRALRDETRRRRPEWFA